MLKVRCSLKKTLIQNIALFLGTKIFVFHLKNNDALK